MPLTMCAARNMPFGVFQISQVHVSPLKLSLFAAIPVVHLHFHSFRPLLENQLQTSLPTSWHPDMPPQSHSDITHSKF
jgi:hypothetical protein